MTLTFPKFTVIPCNMDSETMLIVFSVVENGGYGVFPWLGARQYGIHIMKFLIVARMC